MIDRRSLTCVAAAVFLICLTAAGQTAVNDLLAGKLIDPRVGQWVWYTVTDSDGKARYAVRQAVVGEERVGTRTGHWIEFEIVPDAGYKSVYKVLVTGPASDPRNIRRVIHKQGLDPVVETDVESQESTKTSGSRPRRKSLGLEMVNTGSGPIQAEHLEVVQDDRTVHLWVNEAVKPTGIVRLKTDDGEMVLRNYGVGGEYAVSALDAAARPQIQVQTSVGATGADAVSSPESDRAVAGPDVDARSPEHPGKEP